MIKKRNELLGHPDISQSLTTCWEQVYKADTAEFDFHDLLFISYDSWNKKEMNQALHVEMQSCLHHKTDLWQTNSVIKLAKVMCQKRKKQKA